MNLLRMSLMVSSLLPATSGCGPAREVAREEPPPAAADTTAWGGPVGGLQAGICLKSMSEKPEFTATLVFRLRNVGDEPVRILRLSAQARFWGERLPLEFRQAGTVMQYQGPVLEPPPPPNEAEYIALEPGAVDSTEAIMVAKHWNLAAPVNVEAVFLFENHLEEDIAGPYEQGTKAWRTVSGLWTGKIRSQAVRIAPGS